MIVGPLGPRKVYVDCGAHHGEALGEFAGQAGVDDSWAIYCFEPNPECRGHFMPGGRAHRPNLELFEAAAWIYDGTVPFRQENHVISRSGSPTRGESTLDGWGSTLVSDSVHPGLQSPIAVRAIDLGGFMRGHVAPDDFVVVKMDVEGAEYALLRHMIADRSLALIDQLYVEFHHGFLPRESRASTDALIQQIRAQFDVELHEWH